MSYKCIVASVFLIVKAPYSIFCFLKTPIDKSSLIIIIIISIATNIYTKRGIVQMSKNNFEDKSFLTYNQQMRKLRKDKKILCNGSEHKKILIRAGYFNIINGYKTPFTCGTDSDGNHNYIPDTSIDQIYRVKLFDDSLRSLLLKYITQIEEEVRTLTGYKFDDCNGYGSIAWYDTSAYSPDSTLQNKMGTISKAYNELSRSQLDYVKFYMENHKKIPTWIMIKVVNFSTFIDVINYGKTEVSHSICKLYDMVDEDEHPMVKLLIGSLHWLRRIRNSCAHNERIYCLSRSINQNRSTGRIIEKYFRSLRRAYTRDREQRIFDLLIYFKYYLPYKEYQQFISELKEMLLDLKDNIDFNAFEYIRAQMGIKNLDDLDIIVSLPKKDIDYNKYDKS